MAIKKDENNPSNSVSKPIKKDKDKPSGSVSKAIKGVKQGNVQSKNFITERYFDKLAQVARGKMRMLPEVDRREHSAARSALMGFFENAEKGKLKQPVSDRESLRAYLLRLVNNKAIQKLRMETAQMRGLAMRKEERAASGKGRADEGERQPFAWAEGKELSPEKQAMLTELVLRAEKVLTPEQFAIMRMEMDGYSIEETAEELQYTVRLVKSLRMQLRERLRAAFGESPLS